MTPVHVFNTYIFICIQSCTHALTIVGFSLTRTHQFRFQIAKDYGVPSKMFACRDENRYVQPLTKAFIELQSDTHLKGV